MTGQVPDQVYRRIFQQDGDGAAILEELAAQFYDQASFQPGGRLEDAAYHEGERNVVAFILRKIANQEGA